MKAQLRQLLRVLSRNRKVRKRLPEEFGGGSVICSPEALLSVWKPGWRSKQASGLLNWARRYVRPGMCIWDLGANQGIFSFAAAARAGAAGEVVAFEPDLFLVDLMRRSLATDTHRGAPIKILPIAVSQAACVAEFQIAPTDRALNHLSSSQGNPRAGEARERLAVVCQSLDWLMTQLRAPDLLKIDVEGAELDLLRGGRQVLRDLRPALILETAPEHLQEVAELLHGLDYSFYDVDSSLTERLPLPAWNSLVWPDEREAELAALRQGELSQ